MRYLLGFITTLDWEHLHHGFGEQVSLGLTRFVHETFQPFQLQATPAGIKPRERQCGSR